ncbi:MAG: GldG family protein, partial [Clostridiales bacterium]|nr:GldG family protein [Clostridiales bacterium]
MLKKILNNRRFKYGSMATIVTVIFIAAVVVFNIVAIMIVERLPVKVDLTSEKLFDIGSDTIEYVKNVEEDVTITVLATEDDFASGGIYFQQANEIIKKYPLYTDKINVRYVDLISSPDFAKKYTQDLREYDVIVETKERNKLIGSTDLFEITYDDYGNMTDVSAIAEQEITSALMFVTDKNPTTVTILTGRGEQSLPAFETLLSKNAYDVETTNILTEEISDDSDFVIIAGPESDYTQNEIKKLEEFLDNKGEFGKNIIYIASPTQPELPVLDSFLESWGIKIEDGILAETDTSKSYMSVFYNIHQFSSDNYTDKMDVNEPLIIMPVCR